MIKRLFVIFVFVFEIVTNVPSLNPLTPGATRTEIIQEIWDRLNQIRGVPFPAGDEGRPENAANELCTLNWGVLTPVPLPGGKVRHQIHFRKDVFPGYFGQDQSDNARMNVIFASQNNVWNEAVPQLNQQQDFYSNLWGSRYIGQVGFAVCRREKIEWVEVNNVGRYCDIETWLIFLCMRDDDVQTNGLRYPEDYNTYLGGRTESAVFIDMARQRCSRRIGAVPKNAKILTPLTSAPLQLEHAHRVFVLSSILANYDYVLIRKKRRMLRPRRLLAPQGGSDLPTPRCRDMSLLENGGRLYRRLLERGGDVRNEYDFHWLFCRFIGNPPYRNVPPEKSRNFPGRLLNALKNHSDAKLHGNEL